MKIKEKRTLSLVLGILVLSFMAYTQIRESGEIQGHVTDNQGETLPGVEITITSPDLIGGAQTRITDAEGFYRFRALSVGEYKVTAKLSGFNTMVKQGMNLHSGMTLVCDFEMTQAAVEEEVIVTAGIPTVDAKSSQPKPVIYTDEFLLSLPGNTSWSGLTNLAPGISQTVYQTDAFAWQSDGVDVSRPFSGTAGFSPDIRIIKEASVQSLGLPAEYGEFTGAVLTTVSKSGSNKFSTWNEFRYHGTKWNSQNRQNVPEDEWLSPSYADDIYSTNPYYDISSQFGGKLIHDRLWFFIAGEYNKSQTPILGIDKTRDVTNKKGFAKLTYQLNPSNKINASGTWNKGKSMNAGISDTNPEIGFDYVYPGWYVNLNLTSIFSATSFLEVKAGHNYSSSETHPQKGLDVIGGRDYFLGTYVGNYYDATATTTWNYHLSSHFSHYVDEFLKGSHDIKIGGEFVHYKILWDRKAPGNRIEHYWDGEPYLAEDRPPWYQDTYCDTGVGFIQDRWTLNKRLTLNIGARLNYYRYYFPEESSSRGTAYSNTAIGPRIGITYDLLGDRKNIFKLNYSHYFEGMNRGPFGSFEHRYEGGAKYRWINGQWVQYYTPPATGDPNPIPVESDVSQTWIWEISGSYERELFRDASLTFSFWWRGLGDTMWITDVSAVYAPYSIPNPGPDGRIGTADDGPPLQGVTLVDRFYDYRLINPKAGNPPWLTEDYKWKNRGIEIRFTKRFSRRWQMMASYMYWMNEGNIPWVGSNVYDPNRLINAYGKYGFGMPHQFKLQGNVLLPFDVNFSAVFNLESGNFLNDQFVTRPPNYWYYPLIYAIPVGTRQAGAANNLDLKLEKQFKYRRAGFAIGLDVFNATNNYNDKGGWYTRYGPYYNKRLSIKAPRTYIMSIRISY